MLPLKKLRDKLLLHVQHDCLEGEAERMRLHREMQWVRRSTMVAIKRLRWWITLLRGFRLTAGSFGKGAVCCGNLLASTAVCGVHPVPVIKLISSHS